MKIFMVIVFLLAIFGFSGCGSKGVKKSDSNYYERVNKASKESLKGLDRDTK